MRVPVAGKHVLITGGSTGIGLALAREFVKKGASVTIVARTASKLQAAVSELEKLAASLSPAQRAGSYAAPRIRMLTADVTDEKQISAAVEQAESGDQGPVDILVCNAGAAVPGFFHEQGLDVFESSMRLNYLGVVASAKACYSRMVKRNTGHICIVSSVMGTMGFVGYASYAPTKYAVKGLADCLRNELQGTGVSVSVAFPPDTDTPGLHHEELTKPQETKDISAMSTVFPPDQVAGCIVRGIMAGHYTLSTPDMGLNLHTDMMQGLVPRGPLSCLVSPLLGCLAPGIQAVHGVLFDRIARKHSKARFAKLWSAADGTQQGLGDRAGTGGAGGGMRLEAVTTPLAGQRDKSARRSASGQRAATWHSIRPEWQQCCGAPNSINAIQYSCAGCGKALGTAGAASRMSNTCSHGRD